MSQLLIEDFRFGLDRRKFMLNSPAGTLYTLENGHITSGGEIEKRKKFTYQYLPTDCFGLSVTEDGFVVFGSKAQADLTAGTQVATTKRARSSNVATLTFAADPNIKVGDIVTVSGFTGGNTGFNASQVTVTAASSSAPWTISYANTGSTVAETADTAGRVAPVLPSGVTYTRLQHPDDATAAMTAVIHSTVYNAKAFVIADYGADGVVTFYDGEVVDDLSPGRLAFVLADEDALAAYIADLIDATEDYSATATNGVVTITGPAGKTFSVTTSNASRCTSSIPAEDVNDVVLTGILFTLTTAGYTPALSVVNLTTTEAVATISPLAELSANQLLPGFGNTHRGGDTLEFSLGPVGGGGFGVGNDVTATVLLTYTGGLTASFDLTFVGNNTTVSVETVAAPTSIVPPSPTITVTNTTTAFDGFDGTAPRAQFEVVAVDSTSAATDECVSILADATQLITTAVPVGASTEATAQDIVDEINTTAAGLTASRSGSIVIIEPDANYETWNGKSLTVQCTGAIAIGRAKVGIAKLPGSVTVPTVNDILVGDISIIDTGGGAVTGTTVADLCVNLAYRINTDTDPHPTAFVAAAVGDAVYVSRGTSSSADLPLVITVDISNGTTTADSAGSTVRVTASPLSVTNASTWSAGVRSGYVTLTVTGGRAPYNYNWQQITSTPIMCFAPNSYRTQFTAYATDLAAGPITAQWKCVVTDSDGAIAESPSISVRLTRAGG